MKHDILYLTFEDLKKLGVEDMPAALKDVDDTFRLLASGDLLAPHKIAMEWPEETYGPQNRINSMPGYLGGDINMAGVKWIGSNVDNPVKRGIPRASALIILNDPETKLPVCIMDGTDISAMRTGATGALGVKYLAKKNSETITVVGAGVQGKTQMEAAFYACPTLKNFYVNDINVEKAEAFAREMGEKLGVTMKAVTDLREAVLASDVVITCTVATEPVILDDMVHPGLTYIHMGGPEATFGVIRKADKRVFDSWERVLHRGATSAVDMYMAGELKDEDIYGDISEVMTGKKPGRESDEEFIFYASSGLGVTDIAVAARLYRRALREQVGIVLPYRW